MSYSLKSVTQITLVTVKKIHLSLVKISTPSYVGFLKWRIVFAYRNKKAHQGLKKVQNTLVGNNEIT